MKKILFIIIILNFSISIASSQWLFQKDFIQKTYPHGIVIDPDGKIWIGFYSYTDTIKNNKGADVPVAPIWVYDNVNDTDPTLVTFLTINGITDTLNLLCRGLSLDNNGNVLFSGNQVLYRINYRTLEGMTKYLHPVTGSLTKAACDANGYVYITKVVPGGTPLVILDTNFQLYSYVLDACTTIQRSLLVSPDGKDVYIGTIYSGRNGVRHYHSDDGPDGAYSFVDTLGTTLTKAMWAQCLDWDPWGRLWVGTYWDVPPQDFTGWYALDPKNNYAIVDSIGMSAGRYSSQPPIGGTFFSPRGIAFYQEGSSWYTLTNDFDGSVVKLWKNNNLNQGGSHFIFTSNTGESYSIVVDKATIDGQSLQPGDEIGVFTSAGLCVGASLWTGATPLGLSAWKDDTQTPEIDGYKDGEAISFRSWDVSATTEYPATPTYTQGNGTFGDGAYTRICLLEAKSAGQYIIQIHDTTGSAGSTIDVPVFVNDVSGAGIISLALTVLSDSSILKPISAHTSGTLTAGWGAPTFNLVNGQITIAMSGAAPLNGKGKLVIIKFQVNSKAAAGTKTTIQFTKAMFNEGAPPVGTKNGVFTVSVGPNVSGKISYYSNNHPIADAKVRLTGASIFENTTDGTGFYEFKSVFPGNYTSRPEKKNCLNSAVSPYDAALILQSIVGQQQFSPYQMIAADVSGNGTVSSYDASFILQYFVGLIPKFPVMPDSNHYWTFVPKSFNIDKTNWSKAPDSLRYEPLDSDKPDQHFVGIVYGDPSGNWNPTGFIAAGKVAQHPITIRFGEFIYSNDKILSIPIELDAASDLIAAGLTLEYDSQNLKIIDVSTSDLTSGFNIAHNIVAGKLKLALAGTVPLQTSGEIVRIKCEISDPSKRNANLMTLVQAFVNDGNMVVNIESNIGFGAANPDGFALYQNYPNPLNPETNIKYQIPESGNVELKIFNISGQEIKNLRNENQQAGSYEVHWDGRDHNGQRVSSGIYIYQIKFNNLTQSKKLSVLK